MNSIKLVIPFKFDDQLKDSENNKDRIGFLFCFCFCFLCYCFCFVLFCFFNLEMWLVICMITSYICTKHVWMLLWCWRKLCLFSVLMNQIVTPILSHLFYFTDEKSILQHLCLILENECPSMTSDLPEKDGKQKSKVEGLDDVKELKRYLDELMMKTNKMNKQVVMVIDGLDKMESKNETAQVCYSVVR